MILSTPLRGPPLARLRHPLLVVLLIVPPLHLCPPLAGLLIVPPLDCGRQTGARILVPLPGIRVSHGAPRSW